MLNMKIFYTSEDFFVSCRYGLKERDIFTRRNPFKNSKKLVETKQMDFEDTRLKIRENGMKKWLYFRRRDQKVFRPAWEKPIHASTTIIVFDIQTKEQQFLL